MKGCTNRTLARLLRVILFATPVGSLGPFASALPAKSPRETPLLQACLQLEKEPSKANWDTVLGLAVALRRACHAQAGRIPYSPCVDMRVYRGPIPQEPDHDVTDERCKLLIDDTRRARMADGNDDDLSIGFRDPDRLDVKEICCVAKGPLRVDRGTICDSALFVDGDVAGIAPRGTAVPGKRKRPEMWDGFILNSIVIVNGRLSLDGFIDNSIVIASGPIVVHGSIDDSTVISLDSLDDLRTPESGPRPVKPRITARNATPTLTLEASVVHSLLLGSVTCEAYLRDSIVLGRIVDAKPDLRERAEIRDAGDAAKAPWAIKKPVVLDSLK